MIEQLAAPGDGSGTFQIIESEKILEFHKDETITSQNGSLCEPYSEEQIFTGTYSLTEMQITTSCQNPNINFIGFEILDWKEDLIIKELWDAHGNMVCWKCLGFVARK